MFETRFSNRNLRSKLESPAELKGCCMVDIKVPLWGKEIVIFCSENE